MLHKDKVMTQFRRGYCPEGIGPNAEITNIFNKVFKAHIDIKNLDIVILLLFTSKC